MSWPVVLHAEFVPEAAALPSAVRVKLSAFMELLGDVGPSLGRTRVDTLNGSRYPNMKEWRVRTPEGAWRSAFTFDPTRRSVVLCGGTKSGGSGDRFYRQLIATADARYARHLR